MQFFHYRIVVAAIVVGISSASFGQTIPGALRDATRKAVNTNPEVQARWAAFLAADAEREAAYGTYRPQIDLQVGTFAERQGRPYGDLGPYTTNTASITLIQTLYDWSFTSSEVARFSYAKLVRYYELLDTADATALAVVQAYADVMRFRESVDLAKTNYVLHKQISDQINQRTKAGVGRGVDAETATGRLALAESNLLTEVANLHDVSARFLRIVGEPPSPNLPDLPEVLNLPGIPSNVKEALATAYIHNPAMNAAVENVDAARYLVESRKAALGPRLDLKLKEGRDTNMQGIDGMYSNTSAQIVLNYNLYRGNADKARVLQAARGVNEALDLREKVCRDVRQNVMISFNDVKRLREQLNYLDQHRLSTEKAREAYRQQFDIGQRTLLDLLDTQNEFFESSRAYSNARYNLAIAEARTLNGMGGLMNALAVTRTDLPTRKDLGQDRERDLTGICSAQDLPDIVIDKDRLLEDAAPLPRVAPPPPVAPVAKAPPKKITFSADAFFDYNKSVLKPEGITKLTEFAAQLKGVGQDKEVLLVVGHTDGRGSAAYNQVLSLARAQTVKSFLADKGLDPQFLRTEGRGKSEPVADNKTDEGRARNRRVEIHFVDSKVAPAPVAATAALATTVAKAGVRPDGQVSEKVSPTEGVEKAVKAWAAAWSAKDLKYYFDAYSEQFVPSQGLSRSNWMEQRKRRIESRKQIEVELTDLRVEIAGDSATVLFTQNYRSEILTETSRKSLTMIRENGHWVISKETSI